MIQIEVTRSAYTDGGYCQSRLEKDVLKYMQEGWEPVGAIRVWVDHERLAFAQTLKQNPQYANRSQAGYCILSSSMCDLEASINRLKKDGYALVGESAGIFFLGDALTFQAVKR